MNSESHTLPGSTTQPIPKTALKSEQGTVQPGITSGLSESLRQQYLGVMGIQTWYDPALDCQATEHLLPLETSVTDQVNAFERLDSSDCESETAQPVEKLLNSSAEDENNLSAGALRNESETISIQPKSIDELTKRIQQCQLCELHATRQQAVSGEGNEQASLLIISAAPESEKNLFSAQDKRLLQAMLRSIDIDLTAVYLTSLVKCQPPENRAPYTSEMICCDDHLSAQIQLIQPKAMLILGEKASQQLLLSQKNLTDLRLRRHLHLGVPVYATYHPAELINSAENKRKVWQDLLQINKQLV